MDDPLARRRSVFDSETCSSSSEESEDFLTSVRGRLTLKAEKSPYETFLETGACEEDDRLFIDVEAIGYMTAVVDGLKSSNGFLGTLSDWMNVSLPCFPVPLDDIGGVNKNDLEQVAAEVGKFRHVNEQFQKLSKYMEAIQTAAERRLKAAQLRIGITSLPNEILSSIFLFATRSQFEKGFINNRRGPFGGIGTFKWNFLSAARLSRVCARFRRVILRTPKFWNGVSDDMTPGMVDACLIRSGEMPLDVALISCPTDMERSSFYNSKQISQLISRSAHRWRSLEISFPTIIGQTKDLGFSLANLNLPLLTALNIDGSPARQRAELRILHEWNTPRLHSMTIYQFMPAPLRNSASLRCLDIKLGGRGGLLTFSIQVFHDFLQSCTTLSKLGVRIEDADFVNTVQTPSRVSLPCVETVTFELTSCKPPMIESLLAGMAFPAATELELILKIHLDSGLNSLLRPTMSPFFQDKNVFPALTNLNLTVSCKGGGWVLRPREPRKLEIPFGLLGCIRHLTLSVTKLGLLIPSHDLVPPLRSLRLQKCDSVHSSWVCDIIEQLDRRGSLGELELLSINACGQHMWDIEVNCRSFPLASLLTHLQAKLPRPLTNLKVGKSRFQSTPEHEYIMGNNGGDWPDELNSSGEEDLDDLWGGHF